MSRRISKSSPGWSEDDLVDTFTEVLKEYGVVSKSEVKDMIDSHLSKAEEGGVGSIEETKAEANTYGPDDLQALLPDDVWETVRTYLAGDGSNLPDDVEGSEPGGDVEKSVGSALTTSGDTLNRVRGHAVVPVSKSDHEPAYESTEDAEDSPGDMLLKHLDEELGQSTALRKSGDYKETSNPALTLLEDL